MLKLQKHRRVLEASDALELTSSSDSVIYFSSSDDEKSLSELTKSPYAPACSPRSSSLLKGVFPEKLVTKTDEDMPCSLREDVNTSYPNLNIRRSLEVLQERTNLRKPRLQMSPLETCTDSHNEL